MFVTPIMGNSHSRQQILDVKAGIERRMNCEKQQKTENNGFASHSGQMEWHRAAAA